MEIARAKEILALISVKEIDGANFPSIDEEGWEAYALEIGVTSAELDEYVTLHLLGDLDPILYADDVPVSKGWPNEFNECDEPVGPDGLPVISSWDY